MTPAEREELLAPKRPCRHPVSDVDIDTLECAACGERVPPLPEERDDDDRRTVSTDPWADGRVHTCEECEARGTRDELGLKHGVCRACREDTYTYQDASGWLVTRRVP